MQVVVDGVVQAAPFLDIACRGRPRASERGLLSIAFPPDYESLGLAYVYLTAARAASCRSASCAARPPTRTRRPGVAQRIVWRSGTHQARQPQRRPARSSGPTGCCGSAPATAAAATTSSATRQDPASLLGKMLRIDPRPSGSSAYTVPPGNPLGTAVFATGLRNPWRFSFDRATGDLLIGDVGQSAREEIDWVAPSTSGLGRGRRTTAGPASRASHAGPRDRATRAAATSPPTSTDYSSSRTAARSARSPAASWSATRACRRLLGRYLYARHLRRPDPLAGRSRRPATGDADTGLTLQPRSSSFGEDACGHVYVVRRSTAPVTGSRTAAPAPCVLEPEPRRLPGEPRPGRARLRRAAAPARPAADTTPPAPARDGHRAAQPRASGGGCGSRS